MQEIRPFAGLCSIVWLLVRDLGITFGFAAVLFSAGKSHGDIQPVVGAFAILAAGLAGFVRHVLRCLPITLHNDGRIRGLGIKYERADCQRVIIRHEVHTRFQTLLKVADSEIFIYSHHYKKRDKERAIELASSLGVRAYEEMVKGQYRALKLRNGSVLKKHLSND